MMKFYKDIGFIALVRVHENHFTMNFDVYCSGGVEELDEAESLIDSGEGSKVIEGWIKDSGSMWWRFVGGEYQGPWGLDDSADMAKLFENLYKEAASLLPEWHERDKSQDLKKHPWPTNDDVYWIAGYPPCRLMERAGPVVVLERPDGQTISVTSAKFASSWHPA